MSVHFRRCIHDQDLVQFTLFFIQNRLDFSRRFTLVDAVYHILDNIQNSQIVLVVDSQDKMVGWAHYQYVTKEHEPDPHGEIAYIYSVILKQEYRSSRVFLQGFRYLVEQIRAENSQVKRVQFFAQSENAYLNRLYAKFATIIGEREGDHGHEYMYAADFTKLCDFLWMKKSPQAQAGNE